MKQTKGTIQDECFYLDLLGYKWSDIATMVTKKFNLPEPLEELQVMTLIEAENIHYYYASMKIQIKEPV